MHVLVSPEPSSVDSRLAGRGHVGVKFCWTFPGELVIPAVPCDNPSCGCGESFTGQVSRKGTSVAIVAEEDVSLDVLRDRIRESASIAGWDGDAGEAFVPLLDQSLEVVAGLEVGTLVEVRWVGGVPLIGVVG